jgi:phosphate uptake regulator
MERKLVKQGRNALTVTLPSRWLQEKGLKAGNSVFIEQGKNLVITTTGAARTAVELDLRGFEKPMMYHAVLGAYIEGYDVIAAHHSSSKVAQEIALSLIGMVTEEHTSSRIVLKSIVSVPEDNFDVLLRRAAHLLNQQAKTLLQPNCEEEVQAQEIILDQNLIYCLRYLSKYEHNKSYRQFLICETLELAADQISRIAKHIGKQRQLAEIISKYIDEYTKLLFTKDFKKMYVTLRAFRNAIQTKTYADGLAVSLAELLYNYIGYVIVDR